MINRPFLTVSDLKKRSLWLQDHFEDALNMNWVSPYGQERWEAILTLPLPPLELMDYKIEFRGWTGRVCWLSCNGVSIAVLQERQKKENLVRRFMIPVMDSMGPSQEHKRVIFGHWLNHQAQTFFEMPDNVRKKCMKELNSERMFNGCIMSVMAQKKDATEIASLDDIAENNS